MCVSSSLPYYLALIVSEVVRDIFKVCVFLCDLSPVLYCVSFVGTYGLLYCHIASTKDSARDIAFNEIHCH